jgi:polar amino acid transport system substrate-binding protein
MTLVWLILLFFGEACAVGEVQQISRSKLIEITKKGKLTVGLCTHDSPPFYSKNDKNELQGIDIELAKILAKELNVELELLQNWPTWDQLIDAVENNEVDMGLSLVSQTPARSARILYSAPYARISQAMLVNRMGLAQEQHDGAKNLADIFSKSRKNHLIVYGKSAYEDFAQRHFPDVKFLPCKTQDEILSHLVNNDGIAFMMDANEISNILREKPELKLKLVPFMMREGIDLISIAVPPQDPQFLHFVNTVLQVKGYDKPIDPTVDNQAQR